MTQEDVQIAFDARGLAPAVVQDAASGEVLMLAWMNADALRLTRETGEAHFWSRSRQEPWHKGATSGNVMRVLDVRVDCDADALLLQVEPAGPACHTGERSCFFRRLGEGGTLSRGNYEPQSASPGSAACSSPVRGASDASQAPSSRRNCEPQTPSGVDLVGSSPVRGASDASQAPSSRRNYEPQTPSGVDLVGSSPVRGALGVTQAPSSRRNYEPGSSSVLHELFATILERQAHPRPESYTARLLEAGEDEILKKVGEEAMEVVLAAKGQGNARLVAEAADLLYHLWVLLASRGLSPADVEAELARRRR